MATHTKSKWSVFLIIIGVIAFIGSYFISENPSSNEKIVIMILYFSGIILLIGGIISGIWAFKTKEKGMLKYIGFSVIILLVLGLSLPLLLMVLFGFGG